MSVLGERIRILRKQKGITQEELGSIFGYGKSTVSQWETGTNTPDTETVAKIAKFLNCTTDYLLGLSDQPRRPAQISERDRKRAEIKKALLNLVSHDEGEFPIGDELIDTIYDAMMKGREFHTKRKQESNMKGDDK